MSALLKLLRREAASRVAIDDMCSHFLTNYTATIVSQTTIIRTCVPIYPDTSVDELLYDVNVLLTAMTRKACTNYKEH